MYLNAMEFLEEEREAWGPFEALDGIADEQLDVPVETAHGWSARDLMSHLVAWLEWTLGIARDLAVGERSETLERLTREWDARGDEMNLDIQVEWRTLPIAEVRRRFRTIPGELRGYLTVVPESRWVKHAEHLREIKSETIDHYLDHTADLDAILAASR